MHKGKAMFFAHSLGALPQKATAFGAKLNPRCEMAVIFYRHGILMNIRKTHQ
ncbi:MAG: hypothetical protein ABW005_09120 [Burkholderiaceae bacterium]